MSTRPRQENSRGRLFRRLVEGKSDASNRSKHVALARRFIAQPEASGVFHALHSFLRRQLRDALAIPIAVAADDLAAQGPVLAAIDRAIDGLIDDPAIQTDFLLSFLVVAGANAVSSATAFRSAAVLYAAACAENLVWDESSELPRGLPGQERWFRRPRKSLDLLLLPKEERDVLREAYYEFRSQHVEVILALQTLIDRLSGEPLGAALDAGLGEVLTDVGHITAR